MSEQERDYTSESVQEEIMGKFHGEGYSREQITNAIGNVGLMWKSMADVGPLDMADMMADMPVWEVAETIHENGMSGDFNEVFDAVLEACGKVVEGVSPAKVLGFIYGLHRAGEAALETFVFMTDLAAVLEEMEESLEEEE
jgi:hypothetical protein